MVPLIKESGDVIGGEELSVDWKSRALSAEAKVKELELFQNSAIHEIAVLKSKLNSAEVISIGYMAELDKKDQVLKSINDEISSNVGQAIATKLENLTTVNQNVTQLLSLFSPSDDSPSLLDRSLEGLAIRLESNLNPIEDGVKQTNDVLSSFGLSTGDNNINIPETLNSLSTMNNNTNDDPMKDIVDGHHTCFYEMNNTDFTFVCKCRCGLEVQASKSDIRDHTMQPDFNVRQCDLSKPPPNLVTPSSIYSTPQMVNHGQHQVRVPGRTNKYKPYSRDVTLSNNRPSESTNNSRIVKPKMLIFNSATPNMQLFKKE